MSIVPALFRRCLPGGKRRSAALIVDENKIAFRCKELVGAITLDYAAAQDEQEELHDEVFELRKEVDTQQTEITIAVKQCEDTKENLLFHEQMCEQYFGECGVCMEHRPCVLFKPCGHREVCSECTEQIDRCPFCRTEIEMYVEENQEEFVSRIETDKFYWQKEAEEMKHTIEKLRPGIQEEYEARLQALEQENLRSKEEIARLQQALANPPQPQRKSCYICEGNHLARQCTHNEKWIGRSTGRRGTGKGLRSTTAVQEIVDNYSPSPSRSPENPFEDFSPRFSPTPNKRSRRRQRDKAKRSSARAPSGRPAAYLVA